MATETFGLSPAAALDYSARLSPQGLAALGVDPHTQIATWNLYRVELIRRTLALRQAGLATADVHQGCAAVARTIDQQRSGLDRSPTTGPPHEPPARPRGTPISTRVIQMAQHKVFDRAGLKRVKEGAKWCREQRALATWDRRLLPDLVLAGVQRSGTTALTGALYRLPFAERPRRGKGSHYFSYNYHRGWEWFQCQFPTEAWASTVERRTGRPAFSFDACPHYLFHPFAVERMAQALPDIKVLVMLRDPVRRAESHFHHSVGNDHEHLGFPDALVAERERLAGEADRMQEDWTYWSHSHEHHSYVAKGMYAEQLTRLFDHYPRNRVMVIQSEAFYRRPDEVLARVTDWLGLPRIGLDGGNDRNGHRYEPMDDAMRQHLIDVYREPNERLYRLLGERYDWLS